MSYLHDDQHEDDGEIHTRPREREVTLSTGTILGIFFGLALLCGAFFGFGYNMGSKARPENNQVPTADSTTAANSTDFTKFKPAPGSPAIQPVPGYMSQKEADTANKAAYTSAYNAASKAADTTVVKAPAKPAPAASQIADAAVAPIVRTPPPAPRAPIPPTDASGTFMVQIAAVSHQEDADLLLNALRRKGYSVAAHSETQDKLLHVQVGPFATKKDAEAMKQRLVTDGYLAIIK